MSIVFNYSKCLCLQCDVLLGLPYLKHLDRGDFLADAIEHLEEFENTMGYKIGEKIPSKVPKITSLKVQEFWASEEYFFHSEEQMALVSKYCPDIRTMLFMFDKTVCQLDVLASFPNLEDLDLWGGAFYSDGLCDLLEQIGHRLKKLSLVHIEEVDAKALAIITVTCPNLVNLGLHNCDFEELRENNEEDEDPFRYTHDLMIDCSTKCVRIHCVSTIGICTSRFSPVEMHSVLNIPKNVSFESQKIHDFFPQKIK